MSLTNVMAYPRHQNEASSPPMTFSRFIKETAERILKRTEVMTVSGLSTAIKNDQSCKYLQLKPLTLQKIIQEFPESFSIRGSHEDPDVSLRLAIDVCDNMRNCPGFPGCKDLHICKYFMLDNCIHTKRRTRNPCPYPHSLASKHNKKVLQYHHMLYLEVHTIQKMMQTEAKAREHTMRENAPLKLCYYYNRRVCERDNCPFIHLCEFFVKGTCKFGRRCKKNHDVSSRDVQGQWVKLNIFTGVC